MFTVYHVRTRVRAHTTHTHTHTYTHTHTHNLTYLPYQPNNAISFPSQTHQNPCFSFLKRVSAPLLSNIRLGLKGAGFDKRTSLPRHSSKEFL